MTDLETAAGHSGRCPGCAGTGRCWVCLGAGKVEISPDRYVSCERCGGSGACAESPEVVPDEPVA